MPLCIEKAQFFMRTYGYTQVNQQVGDLYLAIIDALQHILEWYKRAAGSKVAYAIHDDMCLYSPLPVKYLSAFSKGAAFAEMLKNKMKKVELASQAMNERASQGEQSRLKEIRKVTSHSMLTLRSTRSMWLMNLLQQMIKWESSKFSPSKLAIICTQYSRTQKHGRKPCKVSAPEPCIEIFLLNLSRLEGV